MAVLCCQTESWHFYHQHTLTHPKCHHVIYTVFYTNVEKMQSDHRLPKLHCAFHIAGVAAAPCRCCLGWAWLSAWLVWPCIYSWCPTARKSRSTTDTCPAYRSYCCWSTWYVPRILRDCLLSLHTQVLYFPYYKYKLGVMYERQTQDRRSRPGRQHFWFILGRSSVQMSTHSPQS